VFGFTDDAQPQHTVHSNFEAPAWVKFGAFPVSIGMIAAIAATMVTSDYRLLVSVGLSGVVLGFVFLVRLGVYNPLHRRSGDDPAPHEDPHS